MYTVHQAKTNLLKILKKVEKREEVIIARGDEPIAKIVPLGTPIRKAGTMKGILTWEPGAFDLCRHKNQKNGVSSDLTRYSVLVWVLADHPNLPSSVKNRIRHAGQVFVSAATF